MLSDYVGIVSGLCRYCVGDYVGIVSVLCRYCVGIVSVLCQYCVGILSDTMSDCPAILFAPLCFEINTQQRHPGKTRDRGETRDKPGIGL